MTPQRDAAGAGSSPDPTALKFVGPATAAALETASFGAPGIRDREVSFGMLLDAGVNPGVAARIRREHSLPWSFDTESDRGDLDRRSDQVRGLNEGERDWVAASAGDWTDDGADGTDAADAAGDETAERGDESGTADDTDPRPDGEWPETARPDDHDEERGEVAAWPATARPDDHGDEGAETTAWPETARPDGVTGEPDGSTAGADAPGVAASTDPSEPTADTGQQATTDGSGDPVQAETAWRERSAPVSVTELDGVDEETGETLAAAGITSVRSLATADPAAVAAALDVSEDRLATLRETARSFLR